MNAKTKVLANAVPYAVNTLLVLLVPLLSLLGGLHALVLICDRGRKGEPIGPTDVFNLAFDDLPNRILLFVPAFVVIVGMTVVSIALGFVLPQALALPVMGVISLGVLALCLALSAVFPFALIASARDKTPWMDAWKLAFAKVKPNIGGAGVYMLVTSILGSLGLIACGVGIFVTLPMSYIAQLDGYDEMGGIKA